MRFLWIPVFCALCVLASCTQPLQPTEFGAAPPEQNMVDFLQVVSYRSSGFVTPRGMVIDPMGNCRIALEVASQFDGSYYSPILNGAILSFNGRIFTTQILDGSPPASTGKAMTVSAITTDNANNCYIAGKENNDIAVCKYSPAGTLLWKRTKGGTNEDAATAIAVDAAGNVAVVGYFNAVSYTYDLRDGYVAKYNAEGQLLWSKSIWSAGFDEVQSVGFDAVGNVIVAGGFMGATCNIDSVKLRSSNGSLFIASYSTDGTLQWVTQGSGIAKSITGNGLEKIFLTTTKTGEIYLGGTFSQNLKLGNITLSGGLSMFVAQLSASGQAKWAKQSNGETRCQAFAATEGGAVIAGNGDLQAQFEGFGIRSLGNTLFIAKYARDGSLLWLKRTGAGQNEEDISSFVGIGAVAIDKNGTAFMTGYYNTNTTIGNTLLQGGELYSYSIPPSGRNPGTTSNSRLRVMFLAKIGRK
jgi:hypothetical protein